MQAEEVFGKKSPWNEISKLRLLAARARGDASRLSSLLSLINDLLLHNTVQHHDLSNSNLKGEKTSNRGLIDVLMFKLDLLSHFFTKSLVADLQLPSQEVVLLVETLSSVSTYRIRSGHNTIHHGAPVDRNPKVDLSWLCGLSHVGAAAYKFLEAGLSKPFCEWLAFDCSLRRSCTASTTIIRSKAASEVAKAWMTFCHART